MVDSQCDSPAPSATSQPPAIPGVLGSWDVEPPHLLGARYSILTAAFGLGNSPAGRVLSRWSLVKIIFPVPYTRAGAN